MPRLIINPGLPDARELQLKPGTNRVGRAETNDHVIPDPSVSGSHCLIVVSDGSVKITDLGSTNGTYVNRAPVHEAILQTGQTVLLGGVAMLYDGDSPAPAPVATKPASKAATTSVRVVTRPPAPAGAGPVLPKPVAHPVQPGVITITPKPISVPQPKAASAAPIAASPVAPAPQTQLGVVAIPARPVAIPVPPPPTTAAEPPLAPPLPSFSKAPAAAAPATPAALPATAPAGGTCKFHPKIPGRFVCRQCGQAFCELCVNTRQVNGAPRKFCRQCGVECATVQVHSAPARQGTTSNFFTRLPGAFGYPFRGSGPLVLIVGTIIIGALNWLTGGAEYGIIPRAFSWSLILVVFAIGYLFSYLQGIIQYTASGDEEMPPLPSMGDFLQDILVPCLQLIGLTLLSFGPAILLEYIVVATRNPSVAIAITPAYVLGGIYFPMALTAVAVLDSVLAANPLQVIPSMFKVPQEYIVTLFVLGVLVAVRALGDEVIPALFPRGLSTHSMSKLLMMLGIKAVWGVASLYLLTVNARILGLLYVTKKEKLGWLSH